jgi:hypothetical protein
MATLMRLEVPAIGTSLARVYRVEGCNLRCLVNPLVWVELAVSVIRSCCRSTWLARWVRIFFRHLSPLSSLPGSRVIRTFVGFAGQPLRLVRPLALGVGLEAVGLGSVLALCWVPLPFSSKEFGLVLVLAGVHGAATVVTSVTFLVGILASR